MNLAVIKTGGKQYLVSKGQKLKIEKLNQKEGEEFEFDKVLLFAAPMPILSNVETKETKFQKDGLTHGQYRHWDVKIGQPYAEGIKVKAKVLKNGKGEKKIVFRFKNKTRYKKKKGHRQLFTEVEILSVS